MPTFQISKTKDPIPTIYDVKKNMVCNKVYMLLQHPVFSSDHFGDIATNNGSTPSTWDLLCAEPGKPQWEVGNGGKVQWGSVCVWRNRQKGKEVVDHCGTGVHQVLVPIHSPITSPFFSLVLVQQNGWNRSNEIYWGNWIYPSVNEFLFPYLKEASGTASPQDATCTPLVQLQQQRI